MASSRRKPYDAYKNPLFIGIVLFWLIHRILDTGVVYNRLEGTMLQPLIIYIFRAHYLLFDIFVDTIFRAVGLPWLFHTLVWRFGWIYPQSESMGWRIVYVSSFSWMFYISGRDAWKLFLELLAGHRSIYTILNLVQVAMLLYLLGLILWVVWRVRLIPFLIYRLRMRCQQIWSRRRGSNRG
jgi:hypothetical protein